MELLYLWIEDYKNIHHQGFNFNPEYRFEFTPTKYKDEANKSIVTEGELFQLDGNGHRISQESSPSNQENSIYENFFEPSQEVKDAWDKNEKLGTITNITAIIGNNGAGKSNLLDFIREELLIKILENKSNFTNVYFIFVFRVEDEENIYFYSEKKIKVNSKTLVDFQNINLKKERRNYFSNIIFYSNYLDLSRKENSDNKYSFSVSLNSEFSIENEIIPNIRNQNIEKQLSFIQENQFINLLFKLPSHMQIEIKIEKSPYYLEAFRGDVYPYDDCKSFLEKFYLIYFTYANNRKDYLIHILNVAQVQHIIYLFLSRSFYKEDIIKLLNIDFDKENSLNVYDIFIDSVNSLLKSIPYLNENEFATEEANRQDIKLFLKNFDELKQEIRKSLEMNLIEPQPEFSLQSLGILYKQTFDFETFKTIFNAYKKLRWSFSNLSWGGLSSGEQSILNLYSSFYSLFSAKKMFYHSSNSFLILIDEGEVGFHPEWQRKYLKYLIDFFPKIYPGKQIQIILTTHSPFLASDLPKENIIFLKKGEQGEIIESDKSDANGKCIVFDGLKKDKTFGANIHTLLSDGFFLNEGLIGEFAKGKINEIINFYKKVKEIEKILDEEKISNKLEDNRIIMKANHYKVKEDNFWKVQKMIGEEYLAQIIKNHLEELDLILLGKKQAEEKLKKQELERILEKYGIEEIQNFHKDLKRNDKDNL